MLVRVSVAHAALFVCVLVANARSDDAAAQAVPDKAIGTFVGEVSGSVTTRDKKHCRVTSEARLTINIAANGLAKWRGYHRFEITCPGQNAPPTSCWTEGVATVATEPKDVLSFETLSTSKVAGPVSSDRHLWKCGHVEISAPRDVTLDKECVQLGIDVDRRDEIGAQLTCDMGKDFPMLEKGKLTLDKRGQLTFPWDIGNKTVVLKRVSTTPVDPPPDKLYDDFGCRFDAAHRRTVKRDEVRLGSVPDDEENPPGTVEEYCETISAHGLTREGPYVVTLPDGNISERYMYKDGRIVSGAAWWSNGQIRMTATAKSGNTIKTFFTKDGAKSSVEIDGRPVPLDSAPDAGDVGAQKRGADIRSLPQKLDPKALRATLDTIDADVERCTRNAKVTGVVELHVDVGPDGKVRETKTTRSPDDEIADCITSAVKKLSFGPTRSGGTFSYPVPVRPGKRQR